MKAADPNRPVVKQMEEQYKDGNRTLDFLTVQVMHPEFLEETPMLYVNVIVNGHPI